VQEKAQTKRRFPKSSKEGTRQMMAQRKGGAKEVVGGQNRDAQKGNFSRSRPELGPREFTLKVTEKNECLLAEKEKLVRCEKWRVRKG